MSELFTSNFHQMNEAQKGLAESLYQLSLKEISLTTECSSNCDSLRSMAHNGELLERNLSFFLSSIKTLSEKTFEDTMKTIHNYEQAHLEYDVHRNETAALQQSVASSEIITNADFTCNQHRRKYKQLRADVKDIVGLLGGCCDGVLDVMCSSEMTFRQKRRGQYVSCDNKLWRAVQIKQVEAHDGMRRSDAAK